VDEAPRGLEPSDFEDWLWNSDINSITLLPTVNDVAIPVKKADLAVAIHQHLLRCGNDQYLRAEGVHRASRGSTQGTARESND
jgi:hypothetical protein